MCLFLLLPLNPQLKRAYPQAVGYLKISWLKRQNSKPPGHLPIQKKAVIDKTDKLYEQCEALETFLIKNLISSMRNTVQKSELMDTGFAGKMYEDMLYDEYAKDFSKNANFGFAELAYMELTGQRGKIIANHA
jgi:flagellar protein FlgJ